MNTNNTFDNAYQILNDSEFSTKELTYGANGYPQFGDRSRLAAYGFENMEQAEILAAEVGGTIELITFKDGWVMAESLGSTCTLISARETSYDENYSEFEPQENFEMLRTQIASAESFEDITALTEAYEEALNEYEIKEDYEMVLIYCGKFYATVRTHSMLISADSKTYAVAVVIDSTMYPEE